MVASVFNASSSKVSFFPRAKGFSSHLNWADIPQFMDLPHIFSLIVEPLIYVGISPPRYAKVVPLR